MVRNLILMKFDEILTRIGSDLKKCSMLLAEKKRWMERHGMDAAQSTMFISRSFMANLC